jgi:hypothetical protein
LVLTGAEIISVTPQQAGIAIDGFRRFGKGRHWAALNIGDCFSYALAIATGLQGQRLRSHRYPSGLAAASHPAPSRLKLTHAATPATPAAMNNVTVEPFCGNAVNTSATSAAPMD